MPQSGGLSEAVGLLPGTLPEIGKRAVYLESL